MKNFTEIWLLYHRLVKTKKDYHDCARFVKKTVFKKIMSSDLLLFVLLLRTHLKIFLKF